MQSDVSKEEPERRLEALKQRAARLESVKTKLRKVNAALANMAVAPPARQRAIITAAVKYVHEIEPPVGVKPMLSLISNELQSLKEGIVAQVVRPKDLVLLTGVRAVKEINALIAKNESNIEKVSAALGDADDRSELVLKNLNKLKEAIPAFNGKEFVIGRAPTAFTFQNKQKHSSVGYVDKQMLDHMGFKTDNVGGYTILHNQLVLGIDAHAVYDKVTDEDGKVQLKRQRVKDKAIIFKGGKPTQVLKARDKQHLDIARKYLKLIERQFNTRFDLVSEYSVPYNGGQFFWLIPSVDYKRLASAFPGGQAKISKWGFAF